MYFKLQDSGRAILSSVAYNQIRVVEWKEGNVGNTYESKEVRFFFWWGLYRKEGHSLLGGTTGVTKAVVCAILSVGLYI